MGTEHRPAAAEPPTLIARRVVLRALADGDIPALYAVYSDPEVMRYWSTPPLPTLAAVAALLETIREGTGAGRLVQWGIVPTAEPTVVGTCTLHRIDRANRRAEIGFILGRSQWGRGLASAAVQSALRYAFEELGLHRIEADVDPRNAGSLRLLERLGFQRDGYLRERYWVGGYVSDSVLLGLLRPEWDARAMGSESGSESTGLPGSL